MKATGIIRKIDDLGRIVIPKEIRRSMRIREGDPLEIYTSRDGEVIFKKYSLLEGIEDFSANLCDTLSRATGQICAVADRDTVLSVSGGGRRELQERRISGALGQTLDRRLFYQSDGRSAPLPVTDSSEKFWVLAAAPVLPEGDLAGAILLAAHDPAAVPDELACRLLQSFAAFLGNHLAP